ncbi:fungal-specific transcription factor domain-containing protein [Talaromyces proteolyticus]|uniref:Fungal-specific transcription factor domain-containing protein n=1 Tax=Talaromyces proteolyticus TaxID=1131652 RepID=A0AAD4KZ06_9EURO|nr:fungal-specific transcription factor domain-containing protein [Talaromyces proteolyticus]KAH8704140.1 fungal-specific transcription factor domain-containing protein [Talaromyces proteolyticus]
MDSEPAAPASSPSSIKKSVKQACDNCRRRKIKCNRARPCDKCQRLLLSCSYSDILQRKGPKFRTLYPLAPLHPLASQYPTPQSVEQVYKSKSQFPLDGSVSSLSWNYPAGEGYSSPESMDSQYELHNYQMPLPQPRRLSSTVLLAHVNIYLKYLYPIMPVVRAEQVLNDSREPEMLTPQRYAFMAALCAATHVQLKLDGVDDGTELSLLEPGSSMSGEELLLEAISARRHCDIPENMSLESLLTSFFLFAAFGNLDRQDQAWFYLSQTTSIAHTLGLHREATYSELEANKAEEHRRVFWLLFITERAYALQQAKPVMLRNSINKPKVLYSDDPVLEYGFLNLINIFEKLTPDLYDWVAIGCDEAFSSGSVANDIQQSLCESVPFEGMMQIQQVDILVTQQWLQAMMWKLSMGSSPRPSNTDTSLPFHLPVMIGKALMDVVGSVSQSAIDAHGIGMEQKLYDMGISIADVTRNLRPNASTHLTSTVADPKELLWGILNTLSRIRGSRSYLFPSLLERTSCVFGLESPATMTNTMRYTPEEMSPTTAAAAASTWPVGDAGLNSFQGPLGTSTACNRLPNDGRQQQQHHHQQNNTGHDDCYRRVSMASRASHHSININIPPFSDSPYVT